MKTTVAAMDFGTSKLVALVAETSGRQRCDIIGAGIATYDGYMDRQWNAPGQLNEAIANAVHEAETQSRTRIRDINIGVPGDFCTVQQHKLYRFSECSFSEHENDSYCIICG